MCIQIASRDMLKAKGRTMNLTIHLSPETEARLRAMAIREGKEPDELVREAIEERVKLVVVDERLPLDEWLKELFAGPARLPAGNANADFDRELLYEGRGE